MIAALLTALLFAFSAIFGQRAARLFGPLRANASRLCIACAMLGILTFFIDGAAGRSSLTAAVFPALLLSGAVGFGLGDIGLFLAYPRLGARLTILINFSLGTLFAALGDRWLLGESMTTGQWGGVALVLSGLVLALWPGSRVPGVGPGRIVPWAGLGCAVMAGLGQGFGTTLSGWANRIAAEHGVEVHGISQAFQRSIAGVVIAVTVWWVWKTWFAAGTGAVAGRDNADAAGKTGGIPTGTGSVRTPRKGTPPVRRHAGFWLVGAAMFGPVAGVSCYQWARLHLPSAVVVAIAATSTLWVIPLAKWIDRDHPTLRQVVGTVVAVAGIAVLVLVRING